MEIVILNPVFLVFGVGTHLLMNGSGSQTAVAFVPGSQPPPGPCPYMPVLYKKLISTESPTADLACTWF